MFKKWKKIVYKPLRFLDAFITLWVIGITIFLLCYRKHIPEQLPLHWNAAGQIDDYTDAGGYLMLIIMMYFFLAGHALSKLLSIFDIKENLFGAKKNLVPLELEIRAYNLLFAMLWICDLLVQLILGHIILCGVFVRNLGAWFLPVYMALFTADFIWFSIALYKLKRSI